MVKKRVRLLPASVPSTCGACDWSENDDTIRGFCHADDDTMTVSLNKPPPELCPVRRAKLEAAMEAEKKVKHVSIETKVIYVMHDSSTRTVTQGQTWITESQATRILEILDEPPKEVGS